ncbi:MAG: hypothetical protein GEV28_25740 [Actinophytocola sp.]|uniref:hypothetical protein n=1 Tax=Actinophytocola sp. TaxID=1872138 RepID=UPI0013266DAA|nr:hypothetical protein [Actinophytocola sp.]MPZ83609.1 hypothetical protein [Actinophytocola sp.]
MGGIGERPAATDLVVAHQKHPTASADTDHDTGAEMPRSVLLAVDGKTVRSTIDAEGNQSHLLAAMTHHQGLVIAQTEVGVKRMRSRCCPHCWTN